MSNTARPVSYYALPEDQYDPDDWMIDAEAYMDYLEAENERLRASVEFLDTLDSPNTERVAQLKVENTVLDNALGELIEERDWYHDKLDAADKCNQELDGLNEKQAWRISELEAGWGEMEATQQRIVAEDEAHIVELEAENERLKNEIAGLGMDIERLRKEREQ